MPTADYLLTMHRAAAKIKAALPVTPRVRTCPRMSTRGCGIRIRLNVQPRPVEDNTTDVEEEDEATVAGPSERTGSKRVKAEEDEEEGSARKRLRVSFSFLHSDHVQIPQVDVFPFE